MDRVQKIRAEIEKAYNEAQNRVKLVKDEYWEGKVDAYRNVLCIFDSMQEEPTTSVWHDANTLPSDHKAVIVEHNEYSTSICRAEQMSRVKGAKWAYIDDLLKL